MSDLQPASTPASIELRKVYPGDLQVFFEQQLDPQANHMAAFTAKDPADRADFGRMVAASYQDNRALGKRLYVYGPDAITLTAAMERFAAACYPEARVLHWKLWQARLAAKLIRNESLAEVTELIAYLDVAGEHGNPSEANALYGAPAITLDEWFGMPKDSQSGWPH